MKSKTLSFGEWLRREIESHDWTLTEFAGLVGVSRTSITKWVNDRVIHRGLNIVRIARVFGVAREAVEQMESTPLVTATAAA